MEINWFEIIAMMVNFFILLFLLHRFFYQPVQKAMDTRQKNIAQKHAEAEEKWQNAVAVTAEYEHKLAEWEKHKEGLIQQAKEEAQKQKDDLIEQYKKEADKKRTHYLQEVDEEKERFLQDVRRVLGREAVRVAEGIVRTLSRKELDEEMFSVFLTELSSLDEKTLTEEKNSSETIIIRSARPLTDRQKVMLKEKITHLLGPDKTIDYETDENLVLGFELKLETVNILANAQKLLLETEKSLQNLLEKKMEQE